jgi:glyoxylase-like metal-dependent hydrolase (beta-lactamase superfamily II)
VVALAGLGMTGAAPTDKYLETIQVADGIYVFKPKIEWTHGNGVAIVGPDGVFFIDTFIQFNYAEEAIRRLRRITRLPVRYVLNTHFHNDHVMGNGVFKRAFPDSRFIAHDSTVAYMERRIKPAVEGEAATIQTSLDTVAAELATGMTGRVPITGTMRPFWELVQRETQEYQRDFRPAPFVNADITFSDSLTFQWGAHTLRLIHMADDGHSAGDVVVWIPERRLVVTGDLVVAPTPYATYYNSPGMVRALERLAAMDPAIIVPGHGPVMHDRAYLELSTRAFREYRRAAEASVAAGVPLAQALDSVAIPEIDRAFTEGDDLKTWAYRAFFARNLIYHTYRTPPRRVPS